MFTGLVQGQGAVRALEPRPGGLRLRLHAGPMAAEAELGDSVAVDGCCLTVVDRGEGEFAFDLVPETLARTTLGDRRIGSRVNLELPLRPGDRLGGHFVQGHVDAVGRVLAFERDGGGATMRISLPELIRGQVVEKGSVAVDGVSLTVARVETESFTVALIPHTLARTTLGERTIHDRVNLEGDLLAKYVAALIKRA
ncbi:MAG: riboflavin synthase [Planctomycetaceae bacterium]